MQQDCPEWAGKVGFQAGKGVKKAETTKSDGCFSYFCRIKALCKVILVGSCCFGKLACQNTLGYSAFVTPF